jgi:hypothetical protein
VRLFFATVVAGLLAGAAISLLAFVVSRYGPSGGSWSFRGNGALAVYTLVPALLTAGWTALVAHFRGHGSWLALGIGAGLVGVLLAAIDAALLPIFGTAGDQTVGPVLLLSLLVWMPLAPILATRLTRMASAPQPLPIHVVAAGAWFAALTAGLIGVGVLLPAGS